MNERWLTLLKAPHVSEKAVAVDRQYVFEVVKDANKQEIAAAVEYIFNVKVEKVSVCNMKGKPARFGQITGRRKGWKKAYVKLVEGSQIELAGSQS
ncbi:MAG: 50S ribosomal protein L23 [Coxiella sp. RIFCSPHIGHO2_12_FULL_42_15]|nr:MAG: 50S ribosomal protein L23 [Coxiella sp. RIFCSPHIGHO2_12_FULL_42_15]